MAKSTKSYEARMLEMEKKEQESLEKAKRYAAQKKELLKRKKAEESKKRTHRLCQIGGAVESVLGAPIEEEDIPKLIGFLKRQEANGKFFSKAMQKEVNTDMLHLSVNADADHLLAASHKRDAVLAQITLNQVQVTGGKGNKAAIGIVANKDNGTGQIPLASQCDDLTRVVTESQRHIVADAVAGICFIEARQVTADVRQRSDGQFDLRGNHSGVNFIIAELPLQHIAHLVKEVGHGSVHVVDFLIHGFDGLCGLEINGSVHSVFLLIFAKKKDPVGSYVQKVYQRSFCRCCLRCH